ncbi:hypothetical protein D9C73_019958 [Collichthys lucidus]|uniref:Uncharacterized protein n=1 Tax=Collichthys lucidus TaxID=240159 RepID=A0A4U5VBG6_COLLU|nr:hypothetical protein D9C73_019958 [Collichthys lucidus]
MPDKAPEKKKLVVEQVCGSGWMLYEGARPPRSANALTPAMSPHTLLQLELHCLVKAANTLIQTTVSSCLSGLTKPSGSFSASENCCCSNKLEYVRTCVHPESAEQMSGGQTTILFMRKERGRGGRYQNYHRTVSNGRKAASYGGVRYSHNQQMHTSTTEPRINMLAQEASTQIVEVMPWSQSITAVQREIQLWSHFAKFLLPKYICGLKVNQQMADMTLGSAAG